MKVKVSELSGAALDWAVAKCEGVRTYIGRYEHTMTGPCILDAELVDMGTDGPQELRYCSDWAQGGPIIEREGIGYFCNRTAAVGARFTPDAGADWRAFAFNRLHEHHYGPTPLIAAMRCFCTSRLGEEVEIPEELYESR